MAKSIERISHEKLKRIYIEQKSAIRNRLKDFARVPASEYFYELLYCLLTPQSSAVNADKVISILKMQNFQRTSVNAEPVLRRKESYIRFHKNKAGYLSLAREHFTLIAKQLKDGIASENLRLWLVKNIKGLGWKEASHFLRNIGHRELAILDRHILRNLVRLDVIDSVPKSLTPKTYLQIEKKFRKFSKSIGIPIDELDLLFWSMETGKILK